MTEIGNERILAGGKDRRGEDLPWNDHPKFPGVHMKTLVPGCDTQGRFSCLLIRIDPGMAIGRHVHEDSWELHEVLQGTGTGTLLEARRDYAPGTVAVLPQGELHSVEAGPEGLTLLAKFVPAAG